MTPTRLSAEERLDKLDRVFSVDDFQRQQSLSPKAASVYLARWQALGHIARLGPRCGLWVNFLKPGGPSIAWADRAQGVLRKHPQAIVGGESALRIARWMPAKDGTDVEIIIPQGQSRANFDQTVLILRSPKTHATLWALARLNAELGLQVLPPDVAVADLAAQGEDIPRELRQKAGDVSDLIRRLGGNS